MLARFPLLLLLMAAMASEGIAASNDGSVTGTVLTPAGNPVAGAIVALIPGAATDTTDAAGWFALEWIGPGEYVLRISVSGLAMEARPAKISVPLPADETLEVEVRQRMYRLDDVMVIADHLDRDVPAESRPAQVTVVPRADFEDRAATVADVVAETPGAAVTALGGLGSFTEVSLRGSEADQVQVYLDGMLLNEAVGGPVNLATIPLGDVERVEVWRNGTPPVFGGNAAGGAVNIVTRDASVAETAVEMGYGSFDTRIVSGVTAVPYGSSRIIATLNVAASANDFEYLSDNGTSVNPDDDYRARRQNDGYRSANVMLKYRAMTGTGLILDVADHLLTSRKELPTLQYGGTSTARLETTKNILQIRGDWMPAAASFLELMPTVYHIASVEHYLDRDGSIGWGAQDNRYASSAVHALVPLTVHAFGGWFEGTLTPAARRETYRPDDLIGATLPIASDREQLSFTADTVAGDPGGRVKLTANAARERLYSTYHGEAGVANPVTPEPEYHRFTNVSVGMLVMPHRRVVLRANYRDVRRAPSLYELFGDRGLAVSNPGLRPERVFGRDIGVRVNLPDFPAMSGWSVEVSRFRNTFRDLIQWYSTGSGFMQPANVAGSRITGTELVWNGSVFGRVRCRGTWTFQESEVTATSKSYYLGKQLPARPRRYGSVTAGYVLGGVVVNWTVDRKGAYYLDRANQDHKRYPGRTLHDIDCTVQLMDSRAALILAVRNLTDVRTFDVQGMPKPGRSFMLTLRYRFGGRDDS